MDNRRLELQAKLEQILGTRNVYFQPPENLKLVYPCIIYSRSNIRRINADDKMYIGRKRYSVIVIDPDPDSEIAEHILSSLSYATYDRSYKQSNLNHDSITLYY